MNYDNFGDMKDKLNANAVQQMEKFLDKYNQRVKNTLYGMICHAYNQGLRDGEQKGAKKVDADAVESAYKCGYDAGVRDTEKKPFPAYYMGYEKGIHILMEAIRDFMISIRLRPSSFTEDEINEVFPDSSTVDLLEQEPKQIIDAAEKIRAERAKKNIDPEREKQDDAIRVGDEVLYHGWYIIVTNNDPGACGYDGIYVHNGMTAKGIDRDMCEKTGRTFDVQNFLAQAKVKKDE